MSLAGAALFARFAYPPNELGYCGPDGFGDLFAAGFDDSSIAAEAARLARGFEGAWPYLELLAGAAGLDDPLDVRVVEAYWIGNGLLDRVRANDWGWHLVDRFGPRLGHQVDRVTVGVGAGGVPTHAFHVFGVYPWVGLLREGRGGAEPLRVVDRCRIRWGTVAAREGDHAVVLARPVAWVGGRLVLGEEVDEVVRVARDGVAIGGSIEAGAVVACHWDWVCQRLRADQAARLRAVTVAQLAVANRAGNAYAMG